MCCRNPLYCIVPPQMLEKLLQHKDPNVAASARRTLVETARLRGQRSILGQMFLGDQQSGLHRTVYDAQHGTEPTGQVVRREGEADIGDAVANEAYAGLGATYTFYKEVFNRDSIDNKGMRLDGVVHYGNNYDNAFWNGSRMIFGDGDGQSFIGFTKAVDVIGHELTHGVTEFTCNLEYHFQSGALNESMSDVFGSLVKQYLNKQSAKDADWLIGAGIMGPALPGAKALRSMKEPGTAFPGDDQPATMDGYKESSDDEFGDYGGVHRNSGIPNHAFYLLADQLAGNAWEDAGQIWYETLLALNSKSNFQDCADMAFQVAGQRFGSGSNQQNAVASAWSQVGIKAQGANAVAPAARRGRGAPADPNLIRVLEKAVDGLNKAIGMLG